jgi:3-methyl-2-oxobutanoate hydroxymethyltransferase
VTPKFVRRYAEVKALSVEALDRFAADVRSGQFPSAAESYHLTAEQSDALGLYGSTSH